MPVECFDSATAAKNHLCSIVGKLATNLIVAMPGSLPPYVGPLEEFNPNSIYSRPVVGCKPEYDEIRSITSTRYTFFSKLPDAALTTENVQDMRKFVYMQIFKVLSNEEIASN